MAGSTPTPIPDLSHQVPLTSQVGGHAGVMASEDGSVVIKATLPSEVKFYQSLESEPGLAALRPFIPKFYGTPKSEGKADSSSAPDGDLNVVRQVEVHDKETILLENLSFPFSKPNILDAKLGTVLYDDAASLEKRERMDKAAKATTSHETGVRLTGFQVYDLSTGSAVNTPKAYGKSINVSQLPEGVSRFFPIATSSAPPELQSSEVTTRPSGEEPKGTGLPPHLLLPILEYIRGDIQEIRDAMAGTEIRMVGGSVFIVYEADWKRVEEGLKWIKEHGGVSKEDKADKDEDREKTHTTGLPYTVKLIDFAHTKVVAGQGPDQGVLKGIDTILGLLDGRITQVKAAVTTVQ